MEEFQEISETKQETNRTDLQFTRTRMPKNNEKVGIITQRLGGNRMEVKLIDGTIMNCRVPGKFKRSMWLRVKDVVLVEPWEYDNKKGDIIYNYSSNEIIQLKKKGILNEESNVF